MDVEHVADVTVAASPRVVLHGLSKWSMQAALLAPRFRMRPADGVFGEADVREFRVRAWGVIPAGRWTVRVALFRLPARPEEEHVVELVAVGGPIPGLSIRTALTGDHASSRIDERVTAEVRTPLASAWVRALARRRAANYPLLFSGSQPPGDSSADAISTED